MGNVKGREVDLLEFHLSDAYERLNFSLCLNGSNDTRTVDWEGCLQKHIPLDYLSRPYLLPWSEQVIWIFLFSLMIMLGIVGNNIVIWIIVAHRRMRTVTNYFLLNLSIADLLLASGNASFNFIFMLENHWPFGEIYCVISNFVANLSVSTSVFTIFAMSIDRFVAIVRPLRRSMRKRCALVIILFVWTAGALLSLPSLLFSGTLTFRYADRGTRTICYLVWPDGPAGHSHYDFVYNIFFLVVTYALPMSSMAVTYTWVGCILWGSQVIGENPNSQNVIIRSKQRVVHMLILVVALFGVCWLPYHIYFLYVYFHQDVTFSSYIQHVYLFIYWLAMSNSCYNPIIYYWMNNRFRSYFDKVLCFPKRILERAGLVEERPAMPPMATFTCSKSARSCRVILPLARVMNGHQADRFVCTNL